MEAGTLCAVGKCCPRQEVFTLPKEHIQAADAIDWLPHTVSANDLAHNVSLDTLGVLAAGKPKAKQRPSDVSRRLFT